MLWTILVILLVLWLLGLIGNIGGALIVLARPVRRPGAWRSHLNTAPVGARAT